MKTKNKMTASLEIVIVLCSVLLVTLPAIAAEQNQAMQKVSASTITTASEDDFVLDIYGNANEDDTIDMRDLTYVKLIFFGKKPETELADAKYDGKINPLDFIQIKLIIVGKEKELTFEDLYGDVVTVHKPIKRIVSGHSTPFQVLRALGAANKIVGIDRYTHKMGKAFLQDFAELPSIGDCGVNTKDYEAILGLHPDVFMENAWYPSFAKEVQEKLPGVTVIGLVCTNLPLSDATESIRKLGYILDRKDEAEEFSEWYNGYIGKIEERTAGLSEDEEQRVYIECYTPYECFCQFEDFLDLAGGRNIGADLCKKGYKGYGYKVDPEWLIEQNPDVIVHIGWVGGGYFEDDLSGIIDKQKEILNRPGFKSITAVRKERVYLMERYGVGVYPTYILGTAYMAKWFHPELFQDMDPKAIHQEYLTKFQHLDYDLDKHGIFVYPEPS